MSSLQFFQSQNLVLQSFLVLYPTSRWFSSWAHTFLTGSTQWESSWLETPWHLFWFAFRPDLLFFTRVIVELYTVQSEPYLENTKSHQVKRIEKEKFDKKNRMRRMVYSNLFILKKKFKTEGYHAYLKKTRDLTTQLSWKPLCVVWSDPIASRIVDWEWLLPSERLRHRGSRLRSSCSSGQR